MSTRRPAGSLASCQNAVDGEMSSKGRGGSTAGRGAIDKPVVSDDVEDEYYSLRNTINDMGLSRTEVPVKGRTRREEGKWNTGGGRNKVGRTSTR